MKICWDNLENIRLTKNGNFRDIVKKKTYHYYVCKCCNKPFLGEKCSIYCCYSCSSKDQWNDPNNAFNSEKIKLKISKSVKRLWLNEDYRLNNSSKIKDLWMNKNSIYNNKKYRENLSKSRKGCKNPSWNGCFTNGLSFYDTYASQLEWCEKVRRNKENINILEVKCTYCGRWYIPSFISICNRIASIKGVQKGEQNLYCSENCKKACPIYGKTPNQLMKEDAVRAGKLGWLELNREVQPELRKLVLERDGYKCIKCSSEGPLHCHHIYPVAIEPIESADMDNCITLCVDCHERMHKKEGCRYGELRMEIC